MVDKWSDYGDVHPWGFELVQGIGVIDAVDDFSADAVDSLVYGEMFVWIGRVGVVRGPAGVRWIEAILIGVLFFVLGMGPLEEVRGLCGLGVGANGPGETTMEERFLAIIDIAVGGVGSTGGHDAGVGD